MKTLYEKRPFQIRNADEYELSEILGLFVSPLKGLSTPFDYTNTIVRGRMGSGKTIFLRANEAFYQYNLLSALETGEDLILPVMLKLNAFQHIKDCNEIYRNIIIKIIEEISSAYINLQDTKHMARIHMGMQSVSPDLLVRSKISESLLQLTKLGSEEFVEKISVSLGIKGGIEPKFIKLSSEYRRDKVMEIRGKANPGIKDIEDAFDSLLGDQNGKILLLIDEAGSLERSFFQGKQKDSPFEILMNQLRTMEKVRTKVSIYPNSFQDVLTETRYGDAILLEESVHEKESYVQFRERAISIINNYINPEIAYEIEKTYEPSDLIFLSKSEDYGDALEQIINASNGNIRRLIQLIDTSMDIAYQDDGGKSPISIENVLTALQNHVNDSICQYNSPDQDFLQNLTKACRSRTAYQFEFPYKSGTLARYTSKSEEHNILNVVRLGTGRSSTIYAFDYCFCVLNQIPTHLLSGTEKIDKSRSLKSGRWITRVTNLSEKILDHTSITAKIDGVINFVNNRSGFVTGDDEVDYFFQKDYILEEDREKAVLAGRRVRFIPQQYNDLITAHGIELL